MRYGRAGETTDNASTDQPLHAAFVLVFACLMSTQAARAQDSPSDVVTRLDSLEETVRDLTGQVQELQLPQSTARAASAALAGWRCCGADGCSVAFFRRRRLPRERRCRGRRCRRRCRRRQRRPIRRRRNTRSLRRRHNNTGSRRSTERLHNTRRRHLMARYRRRSSPTHSLAVMTRLTRRSIRTPRECRTRSAPAPRRPSRRRPLRYGWRTTRRAAQSVGFRKAVRCRRRHWPIPVQQAPCRATR